MADINLTHADLTGVLIGGTVNEEVLQQIIDVSRQPLEFTDRLGSASVGNKKYEWLMDRLADPDITNAAVDGADITTNDSLQGQRVQNHVQILTKRIAVSLLSEAADSIGNIGKLARQVNRRGQELMRDFEAIVSGEQAAVLDNGNTTAGKTAAIGAWIDGRTLIAAEDGATTYNTTAAHTDVADTGAAVIGGWQGNTAGIVPAPVYTTMTDAGPITETAIQSVIRALFENTGSRANRVGMSRPVLHSKISQYYFTSSARIATLTAETNQKGPATGMGAVNAILTDYGIIDLVPNALMTVSGDGTPDCDTFRVLDFSQLDKASMTGFRVERMAKTGLAENSLLSMAAGLRVKSSEAQGQITSIDSAVAMTA